MKHRPRRSSWRAALLLWGTVPTVFASAAASGAPPPETTDPQVQARPESGVNAAQRSPAWADERRFWTAIGDLVAGWWIGQPEPPAGADPVVFVRAGEMLAGAQAQDPQAPGYDPAAAPDEGPPRRVAMSAFWMSRAEVTSGRWQRCVDAGGCRTDDAHVGGGFYTQGRTDLADHPINGVTWRGARDYCAWRGGRLPTEAEWERAARGSDGRRWPSVFMHPCDWDRGDDLVIDYTLRLLAVLRGVDAPQRTRRCSFDMTVEAEGLGDYGPFGAVGQTSNVTEWVADWYTARVEERGGPRDPTGPAQGTERSLRGGSWTYEWSTDLRAAARGHLPPDTMASDVGFRCVWAVE